MCLAVPMKLVEKENDENGIAELEGVRHVVNISLIDQPEVGDYLIIHAGFAIERLDQEEAEKRLRLFEDMARNLARE